MVRTRFTANQTIHEGDFAEFSVGAADAWKAPLLDASGHLDKTFFRGGSGADGALTISSGTTTLDCAGAASFVKNYTSISITGTGKLAFINPHANGTIIELYSQTGITVTSSATPAIDASGMGASSTNKGRSNVSIDSNAGTAGGAGSGGGGAGAGGTGAAATVGVHNGKTFVLACGAGGGTAGSTAGFGASGGGGGGATLTTAGTAGGGGTAGSGSANPGGGGTGGNGGGALYLECAGAYNVTGIISVAGLVGAVGSGAGHGGGGGGGGGSIIARYGTLTVDSGTYTVSGGAGGAGVANTGGVGGTGGAGASGWSDRRLIA